jgi:hypothetical protein
MMKMLTVLTHCQLFATNKVTWFFCVTPIGELNEALKANQLARRYAYKNEALIYLGVCYMVKSMLEIMRENNQSVVKHAERAIKLLG